MKAFYFLLVCHVAVLLIAQSSYPPKIEDARVEVYRKIDDTELQLWILGESDPSEKKPAIDPDKIAAAGGSAGGHLAASTGTISGFGSDERPNAMILFNPACTLAAIADWRPTSRPKELSKERLGGEAQALSPAHHIGPHTPPTLILHGKKDATVPYASVVAFEAEMKRANKICILVGYEGADHGFFNSGESFRKTLSQADDFLVDLGWIASQ